jgi:DNA-binding NarL/FixJ family response regulator
MSDWISLVEASYELELDQQAWLDHVAQKAAALIKDEGTGVTAHIFHLSATQYRHVAWAGGGGQWQDWLMRASAKIAPSRAIDLILRSGITASTMSAYLFPALPITKRLYSQLTLGKLHDAYGVAAHTGTGMGVALAKGMKSPRTPTPGECHRWARAAAHIAGGLRLRHALGHLQLDAEQVEAVLTPAGVVADARSTAQPKDVRVALREAVRRIDRARTRAVREDTETALDLWEGLVDGRWSLVDYFDTDNRRYVVAVKNDPEMRDPRGLTMRERQMAEFFGMGRHVKEIGYILGLAPSSVADTLTHAQHKLGLESKAELAAFFAPKGMRARLAEIELAGQQLVVGSQPIGDAQRFAALTNAEREVAIMLMQGATNMVIAEKRGSAERTIANQAQSIYQKLGVRSRAELAATLGSVSA